jgi:uncharacterized phage protein (TIGR02218 family)
MPISAGMISHLQSSPTTICHLWRIEERRREINLNWTSKVNAKSRGGTLIKTGGTNGSDDAAAVSTQILTGDGYFQFCSDGRGTNYAGLSNTNGSAGQATIEFCLQVDLDGTIRVRESGTIMFTSAAGVYKPGHLLKVQVESNVVTYWYDRTKLYTSLLTPIFPLMADASMANLDSRIERAVFGKLPTVFNFCNHTRNILAAGAPGIPDGTYLALPLTPSKLAKSEGLKADNAEITAILHPDYFNHSDLVKGRWNKARFELYAVNYEDLSLGYARKFVGYLGEVQMRPTLNGEGLFTAEVRSLSQLMNQEIGEVSGPLCRARLLGDERCGLDLTNYMHEAEITAVTDDYHFTVDLSPAQADGYFVYGSIYWRSGNNQFNYGEIKNNTGNALTLKPLPLLTVQVGDIVTLIAGCNRSREKCKTFVNIDNPSGTNIENMQAEPDIPGLRTVYQFPE